MFSFGLIVFQLILILMIGSFYRSKDFTNLDDGQATYGLITILGFVLMNAPYRKLTLFSLILLLFISFLSVEINFLAFNFWQSCFTKFQKTIDITTQDLISSMYIALAVIITCLDFIGLFQFWQVYTIISVFMTIGASLVASIIFRGLDTYDGGFGIGTFLFSGVCSLMIWMLSIKGKINIIQHKKSQSYVNYTFGFIGVAITLFSWPVLNIGGSDMTHTNTDLISESSLNNSAYINTITALGIPLLMSTFMSSHETKSERFHPRVYIQCFINAGIVVSCFSDLSLNPVAGMTMTLISTIVTLVANKYFVSDANARNESDFKVVLTKFSKIVFRILWSFISVSIGAIVVVARKSSEFDILVDQSLYGKKAGLMVAGWIIGLIISLVFGAICGVVINKYVNYRISSSQNEKVTKITDQLFFSDLQSQIFPIYLSQITQPQPDKSYEQDLTRRVLNQSLLQQQQAPVNIYQTTKKTSSQDTESSGKVQKETLVLKNDFSKSKLHNMDKRDINLSVMKVKNDEEPIAKEVQPPLKFNDPRINITVKPADKSMNKLDPAKSRYYESQLPEQSRFQNPNFLRTNRSASNFGQIYVVEEQDYNQKQKEEKVPNFKKKLTFQDHPVENETIEQDGPIIINS